MFFVFAAHLKFKVYQKDIKSAFLNEKLEKEVYVEQPPGLVDHKFLDHVYKLDKALYGLKQAQRAWYKTLSKFLLENHFTKGTFNKTLFYRMVKDYLLLVQIYVDDIIFGSTNENLCAKFITLMQSRYEMSMMRELNFFLGLQVKQTEDGIFINQSKYVRDILKKFDLQEHTMAKTPMATTTN